MNQTEAKVHPNKVNRLFVGQMQVLFFRIHTLWKEAPLFIKILEEAAPDSNTQLIVYVNFSKEYPDAELNEGEYKTGKIKVMPPKGGGIFKMDF